MKKVKKILSMILILCLLISQMLPTYVFADEIPQVEGGESTEIEDLNDEEAISEEELLSVSEESSEEVGEVDDSLGDTEVVPEELEVVEEEVKEEPTSDQNSNGIIDGNKDNININNDDSVTKGEVTSEEEEVTPKEEEVVEEVVEEEPKVEETKSEDTKKGEDSKTEEPKVEEESKTEEPKVEEEVKEETKEEARVEEESKDEDTKAEEPKEDSNKGTDAEEPAISAEKSEKPKKEFTGVTNYKPVERVFTPIEDSILAYPLTKRAHISCAFGSVEELHPDGHTGLDLAISSGTPIIACEAGTVTLAEFSGAAGNCVMVDHGNGMTTLYAHMSEISVKAGDTVVRGQQLGLVGSTGNSTGPHLHLEVMVDGELKDPMYYISTSPDLDIDFASKRLIVKGDISKLENEPVIASVDDVALIQYETEGEAKGAYLRLINDFSVEVDSAIGIATNNEEGTPTEFMTEDENPITELNNAEVDKVKYDVAVIDTGAKLDGADKIVSVIGDDGLDTNGHGQNMIDIIKSLSPEAKILSIKAIGNNGTGDISAVYAAIKLAIEENVKVINLSISAFDSEDRFIVKEVIKEAIDKGIIIVGAAGNNGVDAKLTIPGGIEDVIVAGSCDVDGNVLYTSNRGDTVDYYVNKPSTSEASAVVSALVINDTLKNYDKFIILPKNEESVAVLLKYLFVDETKVSNEDTFETIMIDKEGSPIFYMGMENKVAVWDAKEGMYSVNVNYPNSRSLVDWKYIDLAAARGNNNGIEIKEGFRFDLESKKLYFSESTLEGIKDTDFADIQFEFAIPIGSYDFASKPFSIAAEATVDDVSDDKWLSLPDGTDISSLEVGQTYTVNGLFVATAGGAPYVDKSKFTIPAWCDTSQGTMVADIPMIYQTLPGYTIDGHYGASQAGFFAFPTNFAGIDNFILIAPSLASYHSYWGTAPYTTTSDTDGLFTYDGVTYNPVLMGYCYHIQYPLQGSGRTDASVKIADMRTEGDYTYVVLSYYTKAANSNTATPGINQVSGGYFGFKVRNSVEFTVEKAASLSNVNTQVIKSRADYASRLGGAIYKISGPGGNRYGLTSSTGQCYPCTWVAKDEFLASNPTIESFFYRSSTTVDRENWDNNNFLLHVVYNGKDYFSVYRDGYFYLASTAYEDKWTDFEYGTYTISEYFEPINGMYAKNTTENTVEITSDTKKITYREASSLLDKPYTVTLQKEGNVSGISLLGAIYFVYDENSEQIGRFITDEAGRGYPISAIISESDIGNYNIQTDSTTGKVFSGTLNTWGVAPGNGYYYFADSTRYRLLSLGKHSIREIFAPVNGLFTKNTGYTYFNVLRNGKIQVLDGENGNVVSTISNGILTRESGVDVLYETTGVPVTAKKVSDCLNVTKNHPLYSLKGTEIELYTDSACKIQALDYSSSDPKPAIWTIGDNDSCNEVRLLEGKYYYKETKAGTGYVLKEFNADTDHFTITKEQVKAQKTVEITIKNKPKLDPVDMIISKIVTDSGNKKYRISDEAIFKIEYFPNYTYSETGTSFDRTWFIKTVKKTMAGIEVWQARFETEYLVPSFDGHQASPYFYGTNLDGSLLESPDIPLGSVIITEVKPPEGYLISTDEFKGVFREGTVRYVFNDTRDFTHEDPNNVHVKNKSKFGGVCIEKVDKDKYDSEPAGDANLTGIKFEVKFAPEDANDKVFINNVEYGSGDVMPVSSKLVTKEGTRTVDGSQVNYYYATSDEDGDGKDYSLPYGRYTIQEVATNGSYLLTDGTARTFNITNDGEVVIISNSAANRPRQGTISVSKVFTETNTNKHGDSDLSNIRFAIVNRSAKPVVINRGATNQETILVGEIADIVTLNTEGNSNESTKLDYGTYVIYELAENYKPAVGDRYSAEANKGTYANKKGVLFKANTSTETIRTNGQKVTANFDNGTDTRDIDLLKVDTEMVRVQGDASIAGVQYAVVNRSIGPVKWNGYIYAKNDVIKIISTDVEGKASMEKLPYGTYQIVELALNHGVKEKEPFNANQINPTNSVYANEMGYKYKAFSDTQPNHDDNGNLVPIHFENNDPIVEGGVKFVKVDKDRNTTNKETNKPQGDALLGDSTGQAEISIYNISEKSVINKSGSEVATGKGAISVSDRSSYKDDYLVQKIYTNAQGVAQTGNTDLPYGTYVAIETTPSRGYHNNDDWYVVFQIREQGVLLDTTTTQKVVAKVGAGSKTGWFDSKGTVGTAVQNSLSEVIFRGGVDVQKINEELGRALNEGTSTLEGNKFNIVNASLQDVYVEGKWYGKVADKSSGKTSWKANSVALVDNITRVELLNAKNAVGGNGAVVKTLTTDKYGFAETALDTLPYGTYYIYEAETNSSMLLDEDWILRIEVRQDGTKVTTVDLPAKNPIVRGDLYFTKVNEDGVRRPNTPFLIASLDKDGNIIESHVIVTDSSGIASTAFTYETIEEDNMLETTQSERKHSYMTNGFDKYVKKNADGSYSVTAEGEELLASGEASKFGIWFSQGLDVETGRIVPNVKADVDDSRGALYHGIYQIFEIQCKENSDLGEDLLISKKFTIKNKDSHYNANGDLLSENDRNVGSNQLRYADTFVNLEVLLATRAKDVVTDSQVTFANRENVLSDTISFSNMKSTSVYKWVVDFVETESGNVLSEVVVDRFIPENTNQGVSTTNQPNFAFTVKTDGTIEPVKNEDGSVNKGYQGTPTVTSTGNVDTTGLDGKSISVVVYLYEYITGYDFDSADDYKEFEAINFITSHNVDRQDENERIYIPKMETTAMDIFTRDNVGTKYNIGENYDDVSEFDAIIDKVTINNIAPKENYMLVEYLWDATNNERFGEEQMTYIWYSDRGTSNHINEWVVDMDPFRVDSKDFDEKTLVVMQELWRVDSKGNKVDEYPVIIHDNKVDEDQSVHYIDILTKLSDDSTADNVGTIGEKVKLVDEVTLKNLIKGEEYEVKAELVYQKDCTDANGVKHRAGDPVPVLEGSATEMTYKATDNGDAVVNMVYYIDSRNLEGISVVSTEYAYHNDVLIDKHVDLEDENQTVHFPKIRTKASDEFTKDNVGTVIAENKLTDTVQLWNLVEGAEYTVKGTLVYQSTGEAVEGVECVPHTFIATEDMVEYTEIAVEFKNVDGTKLEGDTVVVFEVLTHPNAETGEEVEVNKHEDITDKSQTVHFPRIKTSAVDSRTGDHVGSIFGRLINGIRSLLGEDVLEEDQQQIIDTVSLWNLIPGETYTVKGVLMDQDTGEKLLVDGEEVVQTTVITVGEGTIKGSNNEKTTVTKWDEELNAVDGTVDLTFTFDSSVTTGKTIVVFEDLFHNDVRVVFHNDIEDNAQSVNDVSIKTTAIDVATGSHVGDVPRHDYTHETVEDAVKSTIEDTVVMSKLVKDMEYTVKGVLAIKEDSTADNIAYLKADGTITNNREEAITATTTFVANEDGLLDYEVNSLGFSVNGKVKLIFEVETQLVEGKTVVVFEDLYHNGVKISTHSDIDDVDQSVYYPKVRTNASDVNTKDDVGTVSTETTVEDIVTFENLVESKEYEISGHLVYQEDFTDKNGVSHKAGDTVLDAEGNAYTDVVVLEAGNHASNGSVTLKFTVESEILEGATVVAFEELKCEGVTVSAHADIKDKPQTVHFPGIKTQAIDKRTGDQVGSIFGNIWNKIRQFFGAEIDDTEHTEIVDTVILTNLVPGRTYVISGVLMDRDEKGLLNGKEFTATATITVGEGTITGSNGETTTVTRWDEELNTTSGTVDLIFDLGAEEITNKFIVVFEKLLHNDVEVTRHEDFNDKSQFVNLLEVDSVAVDAETEDHVGSVKNKEGATSTIREKLTMTKLVNKMNYKVHFAVLDVDATDTEGKPVYVKADGTTTLDRSEALTHEVNLDAESLKEVSGWRAVNSAGVEFLADTYEEVVALYDAYYNELSDEEKAEIESEIISEFSEMVPDEEGFDAYAEILVEFTFDSAKLQGRTFVVVADVYHNDVLITTHSDVHDEDQSVHFPEISTEAVDESTMEHVGPVSNKTVQIDKVSYKNLIPGEPYEITGYLMNKSTGERYIDADGKEVFGSTGIFTVAEGEESGFVEIRFEFNGANLAGVTTVAFEDLKHNDIEVAFHHDIEDEAQSVHYPKIFTKAYDLASGTHMVLDGTKAKMIDIIYFENLVPGLEYTVEGAAHIKSTDGLVKQINGRLVFVPETANGEVEVEFEFDTTGLAGAGYVFEEKLFLGDVLLFRHYDIDDELESFYIPKVGTVAKDGADNDKLILAEPNQKIVDTLTYEGMKPGTENIAVLSVYDKTLGRELTDIESVSKSFVVDETGAGSVDVEITIDGTKYAGHVLVMIERVFTINEYDGTVSKTPIAVHDDKNDESQTIYVPSIGTVLTVNGKKEVEAGKKIDFVDVIKYKGFEIGKEYTFTGQLINKETDEIIATADVTFKAATMDGEVEVVFKDVDTSKLAGKHVVAFEEASYKDELGVVHKVAEHKDKEDKDQTVYVRPPAPNTGDTSNIMQYFVLIIVSVLLLIAIAIRKRINA